MGWNGFLWAVLAGLALPLVVLVILIVAEPGPTDDCLAVKDGKKIDTCYCESLSSGPIKQPANTLSNLVSVSLGLGLLFFLALSAPTADNPMTGDPFVANAYAGLTIFIGTGSMFLHATMLQIGGWFDNLSMDAYVSFILLYNVVRLNNWGAPAFWISYGALNLVLAVITYPAVWPGSGKLVFGVLIGLAALTELQIHLPFTIPVPVKLPPFIDTTAKPPAFKKTLVAGFTRNAWWLLGGLAAFGVAFVIWIRSHTGEAWCSPDSAIQGHGIWHVLGGCAALLFFFYFRSERRVGVAGRGGGW